MPKKKAAAKRTPAKTTKKSGQKKATPKKSTSKKLATEEKTIKLDAAESKAMVMIEKSSAICDELEWEVSLAASDAVQKVFKKHKLKLNLGQASTVAALLFGSEPQ